MVALKQQPFNHFLFLNFEKLGMEQQGVHNACPTEVFLLERLLSSCFAVTIDGNIINREKHLLPQNILKCKRCFERYSETSNSGHFRRPSLVAVALEVTVVGRFYYMYLFY